MLLCNFTGIKYGLFKFKNSAKIKAEEVGPTESGLLGLLALLLAFTFGSSSNRHEKRFDAFIKEADYISSVVLKADLYIDSNRTLFRKDIQQYVEGRLEFYNLGYDSKKLTIAIMIYSVIAGLALPLAMAARAAELLRDGGTLVMEHAETQGAALPRALAGTGDWDRVIDHVDLLGRPRCVVATRHRVRGRDES